MASAADASTIYSSMSVRLLVSVLHAINIKSERRQVRPTQTLHNVPDRGEETKGDPS